MRSAVLVVGSMAVLAGCEGSAPARGATSARPGASSVPVAASSSASASPGGKHWARFSGSPLAEVTGQGQSFVQLSYGLGVCRVADEDAGLTTTCAPVNDMHAIGLSAKPDVFVTFDASAMKTSDGGRLPALLVKSAAVLEDGTRVVVYPHGTDLLLRTNRADKPRVFPGAGIEGRVLAYDRLLFGTGPESIGVVDVRDGKPPQTITAPSVGLDEASVCKTSEALFVHVPAHGGTALVLADGKWTVIPGAGARGTVSCTKRALSIARLKELPNALQLEVVTCAESACSTKTTFVEGGAGAAVALGDAALVAWPRGGTTPRERTSVELRLAPLDALRSAAPILAPEGLCDAPIQTVRLEAVGSRAVALIATHSRLYGLEVDAHGKMRVLEAKSAPRF